MLSHFQPLSFNKWLIYAVHFDQNDAAYVASSGYRFVGVDYVQIYVQSYDIVYIRNKIDLFDWFKNGL